MKTNHTKSRTASTNGAGKEIHPLQQLFEKELKDVLWAEKALVKAIPKFIKKATSQELISTLENHLSETEEQVRRLEKVFSLINKEPKTIKCEGMNGLIKEADLIIKVCEQGAMRDAGIISVVQKIEHYEISSYGTLRTFANTLGLNEAADILQESLNEEKSSDQKLSELAESEVNVEAV